MPALVVVPANPDDLEAVARLQFAAWEQDKPFRAIFPKGLTPDTLQHTMVQLENDMDNDLTQHLMLVKDALTNDVVAYAVWHFYPLRGQHEIEREMLTDHFPLPRDANHEVGNRLIHNGVRKHHEMVSKHFGHGAPHACMLIDPLHYLGLIRREVLSAIGTSPHRLKQGAASMLVRWGVERADDLHIPCYVESTPAARNVYAKYGFREIDQLKIEAPIDEEISHFCMIRQGSDTET